MQSLIKRLRHAAQYSWMSDTADLFNEAATALELAENRQSLGEPISNAIMPTGEWGVREYGPRVRIVRMKPSYGEEYLEVQKAQNGKWLVIQSFKMTDPFPFCEADVLAREWQKEMAIRYGEV